MNVFTGKQIKLLCMLVTLTLVGVAAQADDEERPIGWYGKAGLGYLAASGNADNFNLNALFDLGYNTQLWDHTLRTRAIGAAADGQSSAERYTLDLKSLREITENDYLFGLIAYQKDRFSGVDQQLSGSVGYGRRVFDTDVHRLNVEAGLGYRKLEFNDGTEDSGAIVRLGGNYTWDFSENAKFEQILAIEAGSDNTSTESISAISATLVENLKLAFSLTIKHNTDVPAANTNTDRFTAISLEYGW